MHNILTQIPKEFYEEENEWNQIARDLDDKEQLPEFTKMLKVLKFKESDKIAIAAYLLSKFSTMVPKN